MEEIITKKDYPLNDIIKCQSICREWLVRNSQGITCSQLSKLKCHNEYKEPVSQLDYYKENHAPKDILRYVSLQGKTFGSRLEQIAKEWFKLDNRTSSTHDHMKCNKTIEQKSARYTAKGALGCWQHIEMGHGWEYLLVCALDFKDIKFYIGSRKVVERLITEGIITGQGKKKDGIAQPQQGRWFSRSDFSKQRKRFTDYFMNISSEQDMIKYLNRF